MWRNIRGGGEVNAGTSLVFMMIHKKRMKKLVITNKDTKTMRISRETSKQT